MNKNKDKDSKGQSLKFFLDDKYFVRGTEVLSQTAEVAKVAVHAGAMFPLGLAYDSARRLVAVPVQLVGLVASCLPEKKEEEAVEVSVEVVETPEGDEKAVKAEKAPKAEVKSDPGKPSKKVKKVTSLKNLDQLIPGAQPAAG